MPHITPKYLYAGLAIIILLGIFLLVSPGRNVPGLTPENSTSTENGTPPPAGGPPPQQGAAPAKTASSQPSANTGRVVFAVTDKTADTKVFKSLFITLGNMRVHNPRGGSVSIPLTQNKFDLLALDREGATKLLANAYLPIDTYNKLSFAVTGAEVVRYDGTSATAKLPGQTISFFLPLNSVRNETSAIILDFDAVKSLHTTEEGTYMFFPVVEASRRGNALVTISTGNTVTTGSGGTLHRIKVGMDENAMVLENFEFHSDTRFASEGNVFKVIPYELSESGLAISAARALELAIGGGHLDKASTMKLVRLSAATFWRITGTKAGKALSVDVNTANGGVLTN